MAENNDPRVYFAAERTLLAWIRTGLALMGFGFVVARFGLYLAYLSPGAVHPARHLASTAIGTALLFAGILATAGASWQFAAFLRTLPASQRPPNYWPGFAIGFSLALALLGIVLMAYLLIWRNGPSVA
jgi:putative membrane protein